MTRPYCFGHFYVRIVSLLTHLICAITITWKKYNNSASGQVVKTKYFGGKLIQEDQWLMQSSRYYFHVYFTATKKELTVS